MAETNGPLRIRDAVPGDCPIIVEFNRLLGLETEHKVMDPAILEQGVACALGEPDRLRYTMAKREHSSSSRIVGQTGIAFRLRLERKSRCWKAQGDDHSLRHASGTVGSAAQETELDQKLVHHQLRTILAGAPPHSLPSVIPANRRGPCSLYNSLVRVAVVQR